ncbi:major capsid protein [Deinococcus multiflagellatus]|uniref:Major capsid protein n=1 Tax=Deinococcus multiflagellatus TaxID=1656887 RepID=A0ABW1ZH43_9DEIO|nr:major capsid protein [Deinococcus multiflagellatus]MBZ9712185.1 major capsid protein [Deinococcus multiflagellatus]
MNLSWAQVIAALSVNRALIEIANTPPSAAEYLSGRFLPRVQMPDYDVDGGMMEIRTVMAGHVGMDSRYPEGTAIQLSTYGHKTAKLAQAIRLDEAPARSLQQLLLRATAGQIPGRTVNDFMGEAGMNLFNKGVIQSLDDSAEYLAMQALTQGKIDWMFNGRRLLVDYKVPNSNIITLTGTDHVGGTTSKLWTALSQAEKIVKGSVGIVMSQNTLQAAIDNPANRMDIVSDVYSPERNIRTVTVRRTQSLQSDGNGGFTIASTGDQARSATLIGYGREGQIIDPTTPGETIGVPMVDDDVISVIGRNTTNQLVSLTGTQIPEQALGYYHVAPTVEGTWRGEPLGRWGRLYTPENDPFALVGEGVENGLPVIRNSRRLVLIRRQ